MNHVGSVQLFICEYLLYEHLTSLISYSYLFFYQRYAIHIHLESFHPLLPPLSSPTTHLLTINNLLFSLCISFFPDIYMIRIVQSYIPHHFSNGISYQVPAVYILTFLESFHPLIITTFFLSISLLLPFLFSSCWNVHVGSVQLFILIIASRATLFGLTLIKW